MIYEVRGRIFSLFFISVRTNETASMVYAQSLEMEKARLPVRLNRPATMTGIPRTMVAITAHKPSHAMQIILNRELITFLTKNRRQVLQIILGAYGTGADKS